MIPPVLLASESPRRRQLLRDIVPEFDVVPSLATELADPSMGPRRLCEVNAERKALTVAGRFPGHLVIGADTLVFLDDQPLGKPSGPEEAVSMLERLSGRIHQVVTGVALVHRRSARMHVFSEVTYVRFRTLDRQAIDAYLARVDTRDKAGGYAIQEQGELLVAAVEGSRTNVIGLPVEAVRAALARWPDWAGQGAATSVPDGPAPRPR